jgi:hypothetical protein
LAARSTLAREADRDTLAIKVTLAVRSNRGRRHLEAIWLSKELEALLWLLKILWLLEESDNPMVLQGSEDRAQREGERFLVLAVQNGGISEGEKKKTFRLPTEG